MLCRPEEVYAAEKTQKERRVAQWGQRTADIRDQKNEKHDDMHVMATIVVGPDDGRIITIDAPVVPMTLPPVPDREQNGIDPR